MNINTTTQYENSIRTIRQNKHDKSIWTIQNEKQHEQSMRKITEMDINTTNQYDESLRQITK